MKPLYLKTREDWRAWLATHHASETEIWLIYFKKHAPKPSIPYGHAVEEALCFGWIDSIVKKIDEDRYAQKFTPRRDHTKWSPSNKQRMRRLIAAGKMTQAGLAKIDPTILTEEPKTKPAPKNQNPTLPQFIKKALIANPKAWKYFQSLAPGYRRLYVRWIMSAKKEETRYRRLQQALSLLRQNKKLGMK
jgi:uncharacterized protein YdeI (YjbR/CyaY-like superfamily)